MNVLDPVKGLEAEIFASEENRRNGSVSGRCWKWIFGWKDIHQRIFADILWGVVQEDTNETFPDLRQKCRRHPRGLPLLGQFDSKWSKLLKLRKVFNHFYIFFTYFQGPICYYERTGWRWFYWIFEREKPKSEKSYLVNLQRASCRGVWDTRQDWGDLKGDEGPSGLF